MPREAPIAEWDPVSTADATYRATQVFLSAVMACTVVEGKGTKTDKTQ
jgi:hypothetical protein